MTKRPTRTAELKMGSLSEIVMVGPGGRVNIRKHHSTSANFDSSPIETPPGSGSSRWVSNPPPPPVLEFLLHFSTRAIQSECSTPALNKLTSSAGNTAHGSTSACTTFGEILPRSAAAKLTPAATTWTVRGGAGRRKQQRPRASAAAWAA